MHYATQDKFLTAAFNVVKETDPEVYARISADNTRWTTDPKRMADLAIADGLEPYNVVPATLDSIDNAFGWTLSDRDEDPDMRVKTPLVFINEYMIKEGGRIKHVDPVNLAASVIVHEFFHVHQVDNDEQPAYQRQVKFARKLSAPDGARIARWQGDTARHVKAVQGR